MTNKTETMLEEIKDNELVEKINEYVYFNFGDELTAEQEDYILESQLEDIRLSRLKGGNEDGE